MVFGKSIQSKTRQDNWSIQEIINNRDNNFLLTHNSLYTFFRSGNFDKMLTYHFKEKERRGRRRKKGHIRIIFI